MRDGNGEQISAPTSSDRPQLSPLQRKLIGGVGVGAAAIAGIGFAGSYAAVRKLAQAKGFGAFAYALPIGVDAGILVLLALDLLLTWLRMPFAMLRHTAWLLTAATIAFNGAAAWPDPIGTGMHAVIPVLFVVVVEAARHAIGIAADISAARHMESVRLSRWLLAPVGTFRLWRRMKLWELRSYEQVIAIEQARLIERARLRRHYGRRWRSQAPLDEVLALRLTRYGRPLAPVEGVLTAAPAPATLAVQGALAPAIAPAPQAAPALPAPPPAAPSESAPERPASKPAPAPAAPAPIDEGAPERPAPCEQSAPTEIAPPAPTAEGEQQRPDAEGDALTAEGGDQGGALNDEQQPTPSRDDAKRKVAELRRRLGRRPPEGKVVETLEALTGYPYTSRRHAQKLRDEVEAEERERLEREAPNVRALTGT